MADVPLVRETTSAPPEKQGQEVNQLHGVGIALPPHGTV